MPVIRRTQLALLPFSAALGLALLTGQATASADVDDSSSASSESASVSSAATTKTRKPSESLTDKHAESESSEGGDDEASSDDVDDAPGAADDADNDEESDESEPDADVDPDEADADTDDVNEEEAGELSEDVRVDEAPVASAIADDDQSEPSTGARASVKADHPSPSEVAAAPSAPETAVVALADSPGVPAKPVNPLADILGWFGRFLFNNKPVASPRELVQSVAGSTVLGTLDATDPEGDPLCFTVVTAPLKGTVEMAADGTYAYVPDKEFALAGGTDLFVVKVTDVGWGLHLFTGGRSAYVPIAVTVTPYSPPLPQGNDQEFFVYNYTSHRVVYQGHYGGDVVVEPAPGTILDPTQAFRFEVTHGIFSNAYTDMLFSTTGVGNLTWYHAYLDVNWQYVRYTRCDHGDNADCTPSGSDSVHSNVVVLMDAPGTTVVVPAEDAQRQADLLDGLCAEGGPAKCSFTASKQETYMTDEKPFGDPLYNYGQNKNSTTVSASRTEGYSDSVQISSKVSGSIAKIVNVELQATYGHTWTVSNTFSQSVTVNLDPGWAGQVYVAVPMYRNYGHFEVELGNTTWILDNVWFDSPNPAAQAVYVVRDWPINSGETL